MLRTRALKSKVDAERVRYTVLCLPSRLASHNVLIEYRIHRYFFFA